MSDADRPSDTELLDWCAKHSDETMRELQQWWATCGPRWRDVFHFRTVMQVAYRKHSTDEQPQPRCVAAMRWSWHTGPLEPKAKCSQCQQPLRVRLDGVITWTDGSVYHLDCLLDRLAAQHHQSAPAWGPYAGS